MTATLTDLTALADRLRGLSGAQRSILRQMADGRSLINCDELTPRWWIEGGSGVHEKSAVALARSPFVNLFRHDGGQPGMLTYRITDAGRAALQHGRTE